MQKIYKKLSDEQISRGVKFSSCLSMQRSEQTGDRIHEIEFLEKTYSIIRFYAPHLDKQNELIDTGLSLEDAKAHCQRDDTQESGEWFDGFREE